MDGSQPRRVALTLDGGETDWVIYLLTPSTAADDNY
jgi:hypothetical protein